MKTKARSSGMPKRPPTACILYTNEFKKRNPQLKKVTEVSKAAAEEWRSLGAIGQAPYFTEYKRLMEVYTESKNINDNTCGDAGDERKPKRPSTAFFLFQKKYKEMHPELTKVVEISKAASKEWKALGDAGRAPFFSEYDKLMDAYMQNEDPTNKPRISRRTGSAELEHKLAQQHKSDSEVADLKKKIVELERELAQQHKSNSEEVAGLKQRIDELLFENEYLQLKFKDSMTQRLDHLEEKLLDLGEKPHEEEVPRPRTREETMSVNHRVLRSSDSANKRVPSSVLAAPSDAVDEMKNKAAAAAATRQKPGTKKSTQVGEPRPSKRAAHSAAGSRASTRKTRGWVW